jgi:hypothetical protein
MTSGSTMTSDYTVPAAAVADAHGRPQEQNENRRQKDPIKNERAERNVALGPLDDRPLVKSS